ncbi:MAG: transporter substrate-binding domain-containing protein [Treponema sp.]|nr:transporter substrate-binding domain-containing protein [Treponema sp.]
MKKTVVGFIALGLIAFGLTGCKAKKAQGPEVVRVAIEGGWRPYNYVDDDGVIKGFDVDVVQAIADKFPEIEVKFEPTAWDGMLVALSAGRFDVVANEIKKNPAREKQYLYADQPYNYDYPALIFRNDTVIKSAEGLIGKNVIVGGGSSYAEWVEKYNEEIGGKINVIYAGDTATAAIFAEVLSGRADVTIDSPVAAGIFINERKEPLSFIPADPNLLNAAYLIFPKNKKGERIKALFDKGLEELRADGTLSKFAVKWFGSDTTVKNK